MGSAPDARLPCAGGAGGCKGLTLWREKLYEELGPAAARAEICKGLTKWREQQTGAHFLRFAKQTGARMTFCLAPVNITPMLGRGAGKKPAR